MSELGPRNCLHLFPIRWAETAPPLLFVVPFALLVPLERVLDFGVDWDREGNFTIAAGS